MKHPQVAGKKQAPVVASSCKLKEQSRTADFGWYSFRFGRRPTTVHRKIFWLLNFPIGISIRWIQWNDLRICSGLFTIKDFDINDERSGSAGIVLVITSK